MAVAAIDNIEQQRRLYGEPLGDLIRRATAPLGLTQARTAAILGLSPAMLSHLMSGQRVKIANPAALKRLQALIDLGAAAPALTTAEIERSLDDIRGLTTSLTAATPAPTATDPTVVRAVLRAVASGRELERAIGAVDAVAPDLADALRVYGTGTDEEIRQHFDSIRHLL